MIEPLGRGMSKTRLFKAVPAVMAGLLALGLGACQTGGAGKPVASAAISAPEGTATPAAAAPAVASRAGSSSSKALAFESIDGPPQPVFEQLVSSLSTEAGAQRIPVASRESNAPYRVRGYLSPVVVNGKGAVDWAWDVYDQNRERVLRVSGVEQVASGADVWSGVDQATLDRIAQQSLSEISSRLAAGPVPSTSRAAPPAPAAVDETQDLPAEPPAIRTDDGPPIASADDVPADATGTALALTSHL